MLLVGRSIPTAVGGDSRRRLVNQAIVDAHKSEAEVIDERRREEMRFRNAEEAAV